MTGKNIFKRESGESEKILLCQNCNEMLFICDIEHFERCPYCNSRIKVDIEVEDYILKPVIDKWIDLQKKPDPPFLEDNLM
ncbi:MAG: hypothetical protein K9L78_00790 [Victivallales bacterium]|nr:hypothetical protein [Victivallales bacterium]MCF7888633.1 hypothetical protein [Victivallales bacterium]